MLHNYKFVFNRRLLLVWFKFALFVKSGNVVYLRFCCYRLCIRCLMFDVCC